MSKRHRPELSERAKKIIAAASIAVFILLTFAIAWFVGRPLLQYLKEPEKFRDWVNSAGFMSRVYFLGIQILQVVVAIIPGEPVEIGAGYAFGFVEGSILCLLGTVIGSMGRCDFHGNHTELRRIGGHSSGAFSNGKYHFRNGSSRYNGTKHRYLCHRNNFKYRCKQKRKTGIGNPHSFQPYRNSSFPDTLLRS